MDAPKASSQMDPRRSTTPRSASAIVSGRILDIAGLPVIVGTTDETWAEAVDRLLGEQPAHPGPPVLDFMLGVPAPRVPDTPPDESYDDLHVWRSGEVVFLRHAGGVSARADAGAVRVGGPPIKVSRAVRCIVPFALAHSLSFHDRFLLHAGALVRDGCGVLALGSSGAGKSTLVLAAVRAGWRGLSDDLVVVRSGPDGMEMAGIAKPLTVPADVMGNASDVAVTVGTRPRVRHVIAGHRWEGGWHPVSAVVQPAHGRRNRSELSPMDATTAFALVLASSPATPEPRVLRRLFPTAASLARLPAWEFRHACEPIARMADAVRLLNQVAARGRT